MVDLPGLCTADSAPQLVVLVRKARWPLRLLCTRAEAA